MEEKRLGQRTGGQHVELQLERVAFHTNTGQLDKVHAEALARLSRCVAADPEGEPMLLEGGVYRGCWLESTGTINAELLTRFAPAVARSTFERFARWQRDDGLIPYKITESGPVFRQIQLVTPPARSAWNHYLQTGRDQAFLRRMYDALTRFDAWLAAHRDTRGTGCVEAFCTFDTGHDLSPRFWHVPDTPHLEDPALCDPDSPILPFLAPDLTASVYCGRKYLARVAAELGESPAGWQTKAEQSLRSLMAHCYDERDGFFYDRDKNGEFVRVQSDVLLRVLACEVGDGEFFAAALRRYLLNTRKFFAKYPFTSIAMDDPRFDPFSHYNTWAGATNFLSLIRAPHAFEHHGRHVELTWVLQPIVTAMANMTRFAQCLSPWTGEEGFTETYSPAILGVLDYIERLCGILPTPDNTLWFTGLLPRPMSAHMAPVEETAYSRTVDGIIYELHVTRERAVIRRDGRPLAEFPSGVRLVTDREGNLKGLIGMTVRQVEGAVRFEDKTCPFRVSGNETLIFQDDAFRSAGGPGVVMPTYG